MVFRIRVPTSWRFFVIFFNFILMEFTRKSQPAPLYDSILKKHLALNNIIFSGTVELFQSVFETVGLTLLFSVIISPYYFAVILRSSCRYDVTCKYLKILQDVRVRYYPNDHLARSCKHIHLAKT